MSAAEWCRGVCRQLHADVARECPAGIGAWDRAWEMVEPSSAALLAELSRVAAGRGDRDAALRLASEVRAAWARAADEFRRGRVRVA